MEGVVFGVIRGITYLSVLGYFFVVLDSLAEKFYHKNNVPNAGRIVLGEPV